MIRGKAVFKCPKTGREVTLHKDCLNCDDFKHWGWYSGRPYISCKAAQEESKEYSGVVQYGRAPGS